MTKPSGETAKTGCGVSEPINTHGMICDFGKHEGMAYTRIPVSYLRWMVGAGHSKASIAKAELERRGTTIPEIEISGHAIDSASLRVRKIWHATANPNEGLHAWLCRMAMEAKRWGIRDQKHQERIHYKGVAFVYIQEGEFPVVKTVMRSKIRNADWDEVPDTEEILTGDDE